MSPNFVWREKFGSDKKIFGKFYKKQFFDFYAKTVVNNEFEHTIGKKFLKVFD